MGEPKYIHTIERLAEVIQEQRHQLGLTQAEVAQRAGVGRRFVVDLERGHPRAEFAKVLAVLDAVGVEPLAVPVVDPGPAEHK